MLSFIFFFLVFLFGISVLFERMKLDTPVFFYFGIATVFLLSLGAAGASWQWVLFMAILFSVCFFVLLYPNIRKMAFLLPVLRRLDRSVELRALPSEEWFDHFGELDKELPEPVQEKSKAGLKPSFLEYLAAGRFDGQFVSGEEVAPTFTVSKTSAEHTNALADTCSRLFSVWDKPDTRENKTEALQKWMATEDRAYPENNRQSYDFFHFYARLACWDPDLAKIVFACNNGLRSLLAARGSANQKKQYLKGSASQSVIMHLVPPNRLTAWSAVIAQNQTESETGTTNGVFLYPRSSVKGIPLAANICGLCLKAQDPKHRLGDADTADICVLVSASLLRRQNLIPRADISPAVPGREPTPFFVPMKNVISLSVRDMRYYVFDKTQQFLEALAFAESLRLIRFGGSLVAANRLLQPTLSQPLDALAGIGFFSQKTHALAQFTHRHASEETSSFVSGDDDILCLEKLKKRLLWHLPVPVASQRFASDDESIGRSEDWFPPTAEDLPEKSLGLLRLLKRASEGDEYHAAADMALLRFLCGWGRNLIRGFGLGLSFGWISVRNGSHTERRLAHQTCLFSVLLHTEILRGFWNGKIVLSPAYLQTYRWLASEYALLSADEVKYSSADSFDDSSGYSHISRWADSLGMHPIVTILFKWFLMPLGSVGGNTVKEKKKEGRFTEAMIAPTAQRAEMLSRFEVSEKDGLGTQLAEDVCKLAWAVRDIYDTHGQERFAEVCDELEWYDSLLRRKKINQKEAELLRKFYKTYIRFLKTR